MKTSPELELIQYTDPYCTRCWGAEPIVRKIEEAYKDKVSMTYRMGGLVADIKTFFDPTNRIGGSKWYEQVAAHWLEASSRHGMPVDERIFFDVGDGDFSTHPANIAYKAALFQDRALANKFLRRMREAAAAERREIQRLDVQVELAEEVGLDGERFVADIESGKAAEAFEEDLAEGRGRGIHGFPTFLVRNRQTGRELLLTGYRQFDEIAAALRELGGDDAEPNLPTADKESVFAFVRRSANTAPREVAEVFDLEGVQAGRYLDALVSDGALRKRQVGNGFFYSPA